MTRTFRRLLVLAFLLPVLAASPARAQLNAGDPCPEPTPGRLFTQEGAAGPSLVCNGTTLEVDESVKTGPYARGIGTASPAATLDVNGEAKIGNTGLACSAATEGAMRYNGTSDEMEYCNGTAWTSLSPAAGGGNLKVYHSDGTTVIGNYLGSLNSGDLDPSDLCRFLLYSNETTGQIKMLESYDCSVTAPNANVWFSATNCTGTAWIYSSSSGYCCTGSGVCQTNRCKAIPGTNGTRTHLSYRNTAGTCLNGGGSVGAYTTEPVLCGDSPCVVK